MLSTFKEKVCHNPDADFTVDIQTLAAEFIKMAKMREIGVINTLFLELYTQDVQSLRIDLARLAVFGVAKAKPSQRIDLLRILYGVVTLYVDDFSKLLAICEKVENGSPEPDG